MRFVPGKGLLWVAPLFVLAGCGGSDTPTATQLSQGRISSAQNLSTPDVVDALFLGSGPLIPRDGQTQCAIPGTWVGFPRSALVRVRVGAGVPPAARAAIQRVGEQVGTATESVLTATIESDPDPNPTPGLNEVTVAVVADPRKEGCFTGSCLFRTFAARGALGSVRVIEPADQVATGYAQDVVGAGVLGLCRIDARQIGGAGNSLMSGGLGIRPAAAAPVLTGLDLAATQAVWSSGASPGASRRTFLSFGLVNIQVGERPRSIP